MSFVANYLLNLGHMALRHEPERPLLFSYYITHRCQLRCSFCSDGDGRSFQEDPIAELSTSDALTLLAILRHETDTLDITGGEPMMRDDLEEILNGARSLGFRVVLNTKGIGIERRRDLIQLANVLILGIDAMEPAVLAEVIGRPAEFACEQLASMEYAISESRRIGNRLAISVVIMPQRIDHARQVIRFAREQRLPYQISPQIVGKTVHPDLRGDAKYAKLVDEVIADKKAGGRVLGVSQYLAGIRCFESFRCHPLLMPVLRPDGRLYYPCLEWKKADISILEENNYRRALRKARAAFGPLPRCGDYCHLFCHMATSLLQTHPLAALNELRIWMN
jgi:MoaA/NifB/PqqE/SkfB family radical SAM enzyme